MSAILSTAYRQVCPKAAAQADRYDEADRIADEALRRRAADKFSPPVVASRADKIVAEADAKRVAYRNAHPGADQAMAYGKQIGHLVAMVRELCNELDTFKNTVSAGLDGMEIEASIGTVKVGYAYDPGARERITSARTLELTGDPGNPGLPSSVDVEEVWCNGVDLYRWAPDGELDRIADEVLERHEAALRREAESGACRAEDGQ